MQMKTSNPVDYVYLSNNDTTIQRRYPIVCDELLKNIYDIYSEMYLNWLSLLMLSDNNSTFDALCLHEEKRHEQLKPLAEKLFKLVTTLKHISYHQEAKRLELPNYYVHFFLTRANGHMAIRISKFIRHHTSHSFSL